MKLQKVMAAIEENAVTALLLSATGVLFVNVILRYFFKMSTVWAEEYVRYAMIWISFIAAAIGFRKGTMYAMDLIMRVKSKAFVRAVRIFVEICSLVFSLFLLYYSIRLVQFSMGTGQISAAMRVPTWIVYSVIPLSAGLSTVYLSLRVFFLCTGRDAAIESLAGRIAAPPKTTQGKEDDR